VYGLDSLEAVVKMLVDGKVTIPKDVREKLGWKKGTKLLLILNLKKRSIELREV